MADAYREALALWREIGDKREIANALYNASFQYAITAERLNPDPTGEGMALMTEALALYREIGDDRGIANVLWAMGNIDYFAANADHGMADFREALDIFMRVGDRTMAAWSQHMLGSSLLRLKRPDEAGPYLRDALRLFHEAGDVSGITLVLDDLASEAVAHGDLHRAARLYGAARAVSSAGGVGLADLVDSQFEIYDRPNVAKIMVEEQLEPYAAEGRSMSLDESVAYALEMPVELLPGPHDHVGGTPG